MGSYGFGEDGERSLVIEVLPAAAENFCQRRAAHAGRRARRRPADCWLCRLGRVEAIEDQMGRLGRREEIADEAVAIARAATAPLMPKTPGRPRRAPCRAGRDTGR